MNTGFFLDKKIPKEVTLGLLEGLVEGSLNFEPFYKYENLEYVKVEGFEPDFTVREYHHILHKAFEFRYDYIEKLKGTKDELPIVLGVRSLYRNHVIRYVLWSWELNFSSSFRTRGR